jgi:hypothetical protein
MSDQDDIKHSDTFIDTSRGNEEILSPSTDKHMTHVNTKRKIDALKRGFANKTRPDAVKNRFTTHQNAFSI